MMGKSKLLKQFHNTSMEAQRERRYSSYSFSTSALDDERSASRPCHALTPGKWPPGTRWIEGRVGPRAGLYTEVRGKILCLWRGSNLDRLVTESVARHYTA
jgi:hypothetical protein